MKENKYFIISLLLIAGALLFLFGNSIYNDSFLTSDNAFVEGKLYSVNPKIAGFVMHVYVTDNQEVSKGDLLLEIDSGEYKVKLQNLENELRDSKTKLNMYYAAKREHFSDQPQNPFSQNSFTGYEKMYGEGIISSPPKENPAVNQNMAGNNPDEEQIDPVQLAEKIKKIESEIEQAKLNLSCTKVYAPQSGYVSIRDLREGDYVEIGQNLLSIVPKNVWVTAYYNEVQKNEISAGQPVVVKIKMYPFKNFKGTVDNIQQTNPNAQYNPQKVPVRIIFTEDYSAYNITPGTSVTAMIKKSK